MSEIKIKDLPEKLDKLEDDDLLVIEDAEDTKKVTLIRLKSAFSMDGILTSMKNLLLEKINTFTENHDKRFQELVDRNSQLEVTCHNLENDHEHDSNRIFELENKLVTQEKLMSDLKKENNDLMESLSNVTDEKNQLFQQLEKLIDEKTVNTNMIEDLNDQVSTYKDKINELNSINKNLQDSVDSFEKDSLAKIDTNFDEINTKLSESINDIMEYIRYYHPDVDERFQ